MKIGRVLLVGAGPGDIGLITVKGLEAIQKAEVILYDRLANPKLLDYAQSNCEFIYCGKLPNRHVLRQEAINDLLVLKAKEGKRVVRLKGGDPGVFGRVGEEAEALVMHQIPFEIVPGISSGIAAPLYAGIPVTHREFGESFALVTAHNQSEDGRPRLDWKGLATSIETIAFYMGISNLPYICENLMKSGKSPETPVILIQWGTFGRQKTLEGTLETINNKVRKENFTNPAITLVGNIVSLREKLMWFEKKPLFGRQILLARTSTKSSSLAKTLMDQGADVIEFPKWKKEILPPDQRIISIIDTYDRILFTSDEGVDEFFNYLIEYGMDVRKVQGKFFGSSTKSINALKGKGFIAAHEAQIPDIGTLLIVGSDSLDSSYKEKFGEFDFLQTSKKMVDEKQTPIFKRMLEEADLNTVIFPSSASVFMFFEEVLKKSILSSEALQKLEVVCMGEKTRIAATQLGLCPDREPESPTSQAMVECLRD
ncbi:uroporphyrinogen-III C-methyltransferase [Bacillus massilinigeriensis]|uniref:uroporphyrinogen-III C-methyltransferase n=1 Tax=Bacillus massilionigeriensis TaxID=1805475 RepID=UPI00096B25B2|nr:uroporphyrinogen-III C-methyltransferase [Bacillus massilionigeriensis]